MEIIKDNYNTEKTLVEVTCPHCLSVLKCTPEECKTLPCPVCHKPLNEKETAICELCGSEIHYDHIDGIGEYGLYYVICPECLGKIYIDDGIDVNTENLAIEHFANYSEDSKHIEFPRIKNWIKQGVEYLKQHPDEWAYYTCSGDSFVLVARDNEEYFVMYTDDYKDVYLKE